MKKTTLIFLLIFALIAINVVSNYVEQAEVDSTMLPEKVEGSKGFQRWITNHKKRMEIAADDFSLKDKNEVYNATFLEVSRLETDEEISEHLAFVKSYEQFDDVAISFNERQLLDYRHDVRGRFKPGEVHYYGLREDKLIDAKILSCKLAANCYFDRAYFLDNHTFVISEISRNLTKEELNDKTYEECAINEICTYTFKLHLVDLINNVRTVYETAPFEKNLSEMIQYF